MRVYERVYERMRGCDRESSHPFNSSRPVEYDVRSKDKADMIGCEKVTSEVVWV